MGLTENEAAVTLMRWLYVFTARLCFCNQNSQPGILLSCSVFHFPRLRCVAVGAGLKLAWHQAEHQPTAPAVQGASNICLCAYLADPWCLFPACTQKQCFQRCLQTFPGALDAWNVHLTPAAEVAA